MADQSKEHGPPGHRSAGWNAENDEPDGLVRLLDAFRSTGDEAQFTQVIAAVAKADPAFAGDFVRVLVEHARRNRESVGVVPSTLRCRDERTLRDLATSRVGRVDLMFDDEEDFVLLVELKLHSGYRLRQLDDYLLGLSALPGARKGLIAVTKSAPLIGEREASSDPRWLGSVRWADLYDRLVALSDGLAARGRPLLAEGWRAVLRVLRDQGDFGPMDFDPQLIAAWARRDEAERLMSHVLRDLAELTVEVLAERVRTREGEPWAASVLLKGQSQPVHVQKNRIMVRFDVGGHERFRIQFLGWGKPRFTAEARHQHPHEALGPDVKAASSRAADRGLIEGRDGSGYHWKRGSIDVGDLEHGAAAAERLEEEIVTTIRLCADSGLFEALASESPRTPPQSELEPEER